MIRTSEDDSLFVQLIKLLLNVNKSAYKYNSWSYM